MTWRIYLLLLVLALVPLVLVLVLLLILLLIWLLLLCCFAVLAWLEFAAPWRRRDAEALVKLHAVPDEGGRRCLHAVRHAPQ